LGTYANGLRETRGGSVEVWALGEDRFAVRAPGHEQLVRGYEEAERTAHGTDGAARVAGGSGSVKGSARLAEERTDALLPPASALNPDH
jgi:hypothetical protein